jgi:hypothetical protein
VISLYLVSQKRTIRIEGSTGRVTLHRHSLFRYRALSLDYSAIRSVRLAQDRVYSGFAVAGSSAAESFPVPSLRLITMTGESILLDRGNRKKLSELGKRIADRIAKPLEVDPGLEERVRDKR